MTSRLVLAVAALVLGLVGLATACLGAAMIAKPGVHNTCDQLTPDSAVASESFIAELTRFPIGVHCEWNAQGGEATSVDIQRWDLTTAGWGGGLLTVAGLLTTVALIAIRVEARHREEMRA